MLRHFKTVLTPHGLKSGEVLFCGKPLNDVASDIQSREIGFVGQSPDNQIVTDKVWHELAFGLESIGADNNTIRRKTAETAAFFGMQNWFEKKRKSAFRRSEAASESCVYTYNESVGTDT